MNPQEEILAEPPPPRHTQTKKEELTIVICSNTLYTRPKTRLSYLEPVRIWYTSMISRG